MPEVNDLVGLALEKNPVDFTAAVDEILRSKAIDAIEAKKIELAQSIYGSSEDDDTFEDEVQDYDADDDFDIDNLDDEDIDFDIDLDDIDLDDLEDIDTDDN
jgi:hypothetical protein